MENIRGIISYFQLLVEQFLKQKYSLGKAQVYTEKFNTIFKTLMDSPKNKAYFVGPVANLHAVNPIIVIALYKTLDSEQMGLDEFTQFVLDIYKTMVKKLLDTQIREFQEVDDPWQHFIDTTKAGNTKLYDNEFFQMKYAVEDRLRFGFDLHRCYYYDILTANGYPQLGDILCRYDNLLADNLKQWVRFQRNSTIAQGDSKCTFRYFRNA